MKTKKIVYMAVFVALGIIVPIAFHYLGTGLGPIFLPMHIPVMLGGSFLGPASGLIIGVVTPVFSSLFTGMPPIFPMLPIMIVELAIYGLVIGYLTKRAEFNIFISLISTMLLGRIGAGVVVWALVHGFGFSKLPANPLIYIWGTITKGIPGIGIQLILIPLILKYLNNYREGRINNVQGIF